MAQYLALAASVASLAIPGGQGKDGAGSSTRSSSMGVSSFSVGVVAGLSLGAYLTSELKRNRVRERMRATCSNWLKTMNTDDSQQSPTEEGEEAIPSQPNILDPISSKVIDGKDIGSSSLLQVLVDPNNSLTSNLHSARITLKSGTRTRPRESKGVELYYILQGVGYFSRDGNEATKMVVNDMVMVNPWTVRSMSNNSHGDLVFLRVSDSGNQCNEDGFDVVATIESSASSKAIRKAMSKIGNALGASSKKDE